MKKLSVLLFTLFCSYFSQAAVAPITGTTDVCEGSSTTLSDVTTGGSWSCAATAASVDPVTGVVTGITAGTAEITYTVGTEFATTVVTVFPSPAPISGIYFVCPGATTTLTGALPGTWSSSNTSVATIDATTGTATGVAAGTTDITLTSAAGCTAMTKVIVYPIIAPITGTLSFCKGTTTLLSDIVTGGTWSSSNTAVATVADPGIVTGVQAGTAVISYIAANTCDIATKTVTVIPLADAGIITGTTNICTGSSATLSSTVVRGVWNSRDISIATVDAGGVVEGVSSGTTTISYTFRNGCGSNTTTTVVKVNPAPAGMKITTHPDPMLCSHSLFHNFGAKEPAPTGMRYTWTAVNATIYASKGQYCLVNFPDSGEATVILSVSELTTSCSGKDSLRFHISEHVAPDNSVIYSAPEFICSDNSADKYQWGYDDERTLDSTLLPGMTNQNYYDPAPDFTTRYFWVITNHNGCQQKTYFRAPLSTGNRVANNDLEISLYPNPADQLINFSINGVGHSDKIDVQLIDAVGKARKAISVVGNAGNMQLSGLTPGVYLVQFSRDGERIGQKVFIKR